MESDVATSEAMVAEINELRERIEFAEEALRAIRANEVDALVVGSDGSERVRTLSGADLCYRTFVEMMGQGAATVSTDGTILYCNQHFCDLLRTQANIMVGASIYSFLEGSNDGLLRAMLWDAMTATAGGNSRLSLRAADGRAVSVVLTATPMVVDGMISVCLVVTDLTEHDARLAAEAASQAKDRFLASLSHELRTPLMPAYMTVAALESDTSLPAAAREALSNVRRNLELETKLIDDLLDLSRLMNGKMNLRRQPVSLHWLIERVGEIFRSDLLQKSLKLKLELNARDTVEGDPSRLQQVLWNVLSNAIKFSTEGGAVTIRTSNPAEDSLQVQIEDQGAGIEPEVMPRIFEAFEQGEAAMMRRQGGLGLGLSIAKPIVEAHGGSIVPESAGAGQGATFTITLPTCSSTDVHMGAPIGAGNGAAASPLRVLLVEDHVETARLLKVILEHSGHTVAVAGDVKSAMQLADNGQFDIVVSDIGLPDGTGYELMKRIRERHQIPGVALTGYGMDDDLQRSREAGFADHIIKPVDAYQLESVLHRVAGAAKMASGN